MSESQGSAAAGGATRYQRSPSGLLAATVVTVLAVLAFVGFRSLTRDNAATPVQTIDYSLSLKAGRNAHVLRTLAPPKLPAGWRATSAAYDSRAEPSWHLGMLTKTGKYMGIDESRASLSELAQAHVDENAVRGQDITIKGVRWQVWTDAGGDYAVGRTLTVRGVPVESWLVGGSAPDAQVRDFAASLQGGVTKAEAAAG